MQTSHHESKHTFFIVFNLILVTIAIGVIASMLRTYYDYKRLENTAVTLEAEIVLVEEYTDSDDNTQYRKYISYAYQGMLYENIRHDTAKGGQGAKVIIEIDPENPGFLRPKDSNLGFAITFAILFAAPMLLWLAHSVSNAIASAKAYGIWYTMYQSVWISTELVEKELTFQTRFRRKVRLVISCTFATLGILASILYYLDSGYWIAVIPLGLAVTPMVWFSVHRFRMKENLQLRLHTDTILEASSERDSENDLVYYFLFEHYGKWYINPECFVNIRKINFSDLRSGYRVIIVQNEWKQILRMFSADEFRSI